MGNEDCDESTGVVEGERVFIGVDKVCKAVCNQLSPCVGGAEGVVYGFINLMNFQPGLFC